MNQRFVGLCVAALAVTSTHSAATSDTPRHNGAPHVDILINGTQQQQYFHNRRWYVEALKGREYAIRLHNPYGVRVAVALSVDGLNTIDARETTAADARKWVLDPYQTVTISGWQTSRTEARRFEFTSEAGSYGQALGKTANLGVISAVFFRERARPHESLTLRAQPTAPPAASAAQNAASADSRQEKVADEYAATGMGRRTGHAVTQVSMDLENAPAHTVNIRYEFRAQLVRLGVLRDVAAADPLKRREHAQGFEPGFCPEPRR
jgi:hypothetical protein